MDVIDATGRDPLIVASAQIWAEATAARDGQDEVAGLDVSRPVIQGVLDRSSRTLLGMRRRLKAAGYTRLELSV